MHKQLIALLLLKRYPEFKDETIAFLNDAMSRKDDWTKQNISTIRLVLDHFGHHSSNALSERV